MRFRSRRTASLKIAVRLAALVNILLATYALAQTDGVAAGSRTDIASPTVNSRDTLVDIRKGLNPWRPKVFLDNLKNFEALRVGSVRIELPWQVVQPRADVFDWNSSDAVVSAAQAHGMEVLFTLRAVSTWGTRQPQRGNDLYHNASAPLDFAQWESFMRVLAARYRGRHVAYEIENEPNLSSYWNGTQDEYLQVLKSSYRGLKLGDPDAHVLTGAISCGIVFNYRNPRVAAKIAEQNDAWLRAILATRAFDALSVHDYYFPDHAENGWTFTSYLTHIRDVAREAGMETVPIWVTEAGYVAVPTKAGDRIDNGTPEKQAEWLTAAYQQAFKLGVARVYWLFLQDHPNAAYFGGMGLMDSNGKLRPAWQAMQQVFDAGRPASD